MLALIAILPLTMPLPEPPLPAEVEIAGWYDYAPEPGDKPAGIVTVTPNKAVAGAFVLHWLAPGMEPVMGVALRDGNSLWVSYRGGQSFGICRYRIERDKAGNPTLIGDRGTAEVLTWLRK